MFPTFFLANEVNELDNERRRDEERKKERREGRETRGVKKGERGKEEWMEYDNGRIMNGERNMIMKRNMVVKK